MAQAAYSKIRAENVQVLIKEIKVRKKMDNKAMANMLGLPQYIPQTAKAPRRI